jgi:hypothetical protein
MSPMMFGLLASSLPLVALGVVSPIRWRLPAAVVVVAGAVLAGSHLGILGFTDLWKLPIGVGMTDTLVLTVLWLIFGVVSRAVGPIAVFGPPWVTAMVMGAVLGEVPAAAILSGGAKTPGGAARLALSAAGGGMIGRMGDPAMLMLMDGHTDAMLAIAPLGVFLAWLMRPAAEDLVKPSEASRLRLGLLIGVALIAAIPGLTASALIAGILGLGLMAQARRCPLDLAGPAWQLLAAIGALIAVAGGTPELAAQGLELVTELLDWWAPPLMVLATAILTALTDATAMSLVATAIVERAMSLDQTLVVAPLAVGVSVGGLAPLVAAGALRAGLKLWLLQVAVAVIWACVWAWC